MSQQHTVEMPPLVLVEQLKTRYVCVSVWSLGALPAQSHVTEYVGKYKAIGYRDTDENGDSTFNMVNWAVVLPLTPEEIRLNEALAILSTMKNFGLVKYREELSDRVEAVLHA